LSRPKPTRVAEPTEEEEEEYGLKDQSRNSRAREFLDMQQCISSSKPDTAVSSKKLDIFHSYLSKYKL